MPKNTSKKSSKSLKKKTKTPAQLKKKADELFSKYIRLKNADQEGWVSCYTCAASVEWKYIQNGHFVSRVHLSTRWDEENCRPQCYSCNCLRNGNYDVYSLRLTKEKGPDILEELNRRKNLTKVMKRADYEILIEDLTLKLKEYD